MYIYIHYYMLLLFIYIYICYIYCVCDPILSMRLIPYYPRQVRRRLASLVGGWTHLPDTAFDFWPLGFLGFLGGKQCDDVDFTGFKPSSDI